jgi:eukaryotic-like serine/threonine-protein kinase
MTPEQYQKVKEIFHAASERQPGTRTEFIVEACAGDDLLLREVESLLDFQSHSENFIENSAFEVGAKLITGDHEFKGRRVGHYRLIRELGYGGMGAVYLAERADDQFRKQVAIKVVRGGLATEETRRRFLHERQILAGIDHSNIAKLLDGGTTDEGLPYLVMDYVEGVSINGYCDAHELSTTERLRLFREVCSAVQYAHQRLVIHRDIKPANILVTNDGIPKLLDFGIAKLLDPELSETAAHTGTEVRLMTPEYASPEQIRGEQITTATDVYSLGVLLYEMLTGRRPYRITSRRPAEIAKAICDQEPEKPSGSIADFRIRNGESKNNPKSEFPDPKLLRGDLDNIVIKAIQKEPHRRYSSVEQFSEDIRRHLDGLPVIARADTFAYRSGKFIRRHRFGVAAAALVLVIFMAGVAGVVWQARVAARERDQARLEKAKAERVNSFLQEMLSSADPLKKGSNVKAADLLADAARRAQLDLGNQPAMQAEVLRTIGNTYSGLGLINEGEPLLLRSLEIHRQLFGSGHRETARTLYDLAQLLRAKGDFDQAEAHFREALAVQRQLAPKGDIETATTLFYFGAVLFQHGKTEESERANREALEMTRIVAGNDHLMAGLALNQSGLLREYSGDLNAAEQLYRQALETFRRGGAQSAEKSLVLMNLATNLTSQKKFNEADGAFQEGLKNSRSLYGEQHPNLAIISTHYARMYFLKGDYGRAEMILRPPLEIMRKSLPAGHPESAQTLVTLGIVLVRGGRALEGEPYLREALAIREQALPKGHWTTANVRSMLGECLLVQRRYAEAEPLLKQGYDEISAALGQEHPRTIEAIERLVSFYESGKQPERAASYRALLAGNAGGSPAGSGGSRAWLS